MPTKFLTLSQRCYKQALYVPTCTIPGAQPHTQPPDDTSSAKGRLPAISHSVSEKSWGFVEVYQGGRHYHTATLTD